MKPIALVIAIAAMTAAPVHAQMHKCVDERGITTYTDKPPPDCKGGPVDIRPAPPISGKAEQRQEDLIGAEGDFQRRQIDRTRKDQEDARRLEAQKRQCAGMNAEYQRLTSGNRLARINEKGERIYVDDADRESRAARLKADMARQCRS